MKICTVCEKEKDEAEFTMKRGKRNAACRICTRKRSKGHYDKNAQYYIDKKNKAKARSIRFVHLVRVFGKCPCGESDPVCLDFHHRESDEKECHLGEVARLGWSLTRIKKELKKCDILCSNCHRKLHARLV